MTNTTGPKSDAQLKLDIESELEWDPTVDAAQIGISIDGGAVTLVGRADSYAARWAAEQAARRVVGVRSVTQSLTVHVRAEHRRTDAELAAATERMLTWNVLVPKTVTARVERGVLTLQGEVRWSFQRTAAELSVRHIKGVVAVRDAVQLKPKPHARRRDESSSNGR